MDDLGRPRAASYLHRRYEAHARSDSGDGGKAAGSARRAKIG